MGKRVRGEGRKERGSDRSIDESVQPWRSFKGNTGETSDRAREYRLALNRTKV